MTCTIDTKNIIARFCNELAARLGPAKFGLWFEEIATIEVQGDGSLRINVPSQFHADWIEANFRNELDELAGEVLEGPAVVSLGVVDEVLRPGEGGSIEGAVSAPIERPGIVHGEVLRSANSNGAPSSLMTTSGQVNGGRPGSEMTDGVGGGSGVNGRREVVVQPDRWRRTGGEARGGGAGVMTNGQGGGSGLIAGSAGARARARGVNPFDDRHDLACFVTGPGNDLAYHAAMRLAENDAAFSPLCMHGGCGLGKTHLLQGICRHYRARFPGAKIRYVTGENFTNEFIAAVRATKLDQFRKKMRALDLLAIDDVHFLSNKNATQKEFLCTLDAIGLSGARIVLASDNHPRFINDFHQRLVSRLVSGMVVEVRMPDRETRLRIIRQISMQRGLRINQAAVEALADRCVGSIREIEGTLTRLNALHELLYRAEEAAGDGTPEIGLILVNKVLESQASLPSRPIPVSQIVAEVSRRCGVTSEQVLGRSRHKRVVLARSLASYLARQLTTKSYPEIARALAKKNHSTIIAADRRIQKLMETDERVDLGLDEVSVSIRYAVDTLRSAVIANRNHQ